MKIIDFRARPNTEQYMRLYEGTYAWDNFFNFPGSCCKTEEGIGSV